MVLIVQKNCPFCTDVKNLHLEFPEIKKFIYVEETNTAHPWDNEAEFFKMDVELPGFPALVVGNHVYVGSNLILEQIDKLRKEKTGVSYAEAN